MNRGGKRGEKRRRKKKKQKKTTDEVCGVRGETTCG